MHNILASFFGIAFLLQILTTSAGAQAVNREMIDGFLAEGEVKTAEKALESALKDGSELTYLDSIYIFKNLGVLYASKPKTQSKGEKCFTILLGLDPFASLHDTYASNTIIARYKKTRRAYQLQKGGKALIPTVAVFDITGEAKTLSPEERVTLTHQLIGELQRLEVFHTLDRSFVTETLQRMRKQADQCTDRTCRIDMARRLTADKMALIEIGHLDTSWVFQLTLVDVETGQTSTSLQKIFAYSDLKRVVTEGFPLLAQDLQEQEAAWLNLSLNPSNATLTIDGTPRANLKSRLPLNPGKHALCAESPGYAGECKEFEVKKNDAVTYAFNLKPTGGIKEPEAKENTRAMMEDDENEGGAHSGAPPGKFILLTLGAMAGLAVALLLLLNTKD